MLAQVLCRSWFSNLVSFRYVSVVLNFLHDTFSIKFYTISFLRSFHGIFYIFFIDEKHYAMNFGYWSKSISWKYFIFHEIPWMKNFTVYPPLKWLCKHIKKVRSRANLVFQWIFVLNSVKRKFFRVSIVKKKLP